LEGFTDIEYVKVPYSRASNVVGSGEADLSMETAPSLVPAIDKGKAVVGIGGVHAGCYELFGHDKVRALHDLKGAAVAVSAEDGADHIFLSSIASYIGMDPARDINWIFAGKTSETIRLFSEGKADAFLGFPPHPQILRANRIGHVVLNVGEDRPWSQYFCCVLTANRNFMNRNPVATKRALRAILQAGDLCSADPERGARLLVAKGFAPSYEVALAVLKSIRYRRWREADPEDTLRFYALRLKEAGIIRSNPQTILANGTDWRFWHELKMELKA
jgi:NitT/TauT family transport system substrate-binding protein